jgi:hypothetical protein
LGSRLAAIRSKIARVAARRSRRSLGTLTDRSCGRPFDSRTTARSGCSARLSSPVTRWAPEQILGDRRGITTAGQVALMTLGYRKVVIWIRKSAGPGYSCRVGQPSQGLRRASQKPHNSATRRPIPPRNPTDETAHSGTLVMRGKETENSRSAASMRVSWAVGGFSR